jgi:hypothetical protein
VNSKAIGRFLFASATILGLLYVAALAGGFTGLVIPLSEYKPHDYLLKKGDKINPLNSFDFDSGSWEVYLAISPDNFDRLPPSIIRSIALKTSDKTLLKRAQQTWRFTYTGGDMATITNRIYFVRDGALVFVSGIAIDNAAEGLQSGQFGWIEPDEKNAISNVVKDFERVYWPVVIL